MRVFTVIFCISCFFTSSAKIADEIVLQQSTFIKISNRSIMTKTFSEKILVLNGDPDGREIVLPFQLKERIHNLNATIWDANGDLVKKVKLKEFNDLSYLSSNLQDDNRKKVYQIKEVYPYTIEWSYNMDLNNFITFPGWYPQQSNVVEVNQAELKIELPENWELDYRVENMQPEMQVLEEGNSQIYNFSIKNLNSFEIEAFSGSRVDCLPKVRFKTNFFIDDNLEGNNLTWIEFGQFYYYLNKDKAKLTDELKAYAVQMSEKYSNKKQLIAALYKDVQQSKRYVSIQLGIGGYESTSAQEVSFYGYGDCKALSNYMGALLKACDIETYPVLIEAGSMVQDIDASFVCHQFNHVIQVAIVDKDTIWLECTSKYSPVGYLGSFTSNRSGLLIKNEESSLIKTPIYPKEVSFKKRDINIVVDENGAAILKVVEQLSGEQQDEIRGVFQGYSKSKQKLFLEEYYLNYANSTLIAFEVDSISESHPYLQFQYSLSMAQFVKFMANRMFLKMDGLGFSFPSFEIKETRNFPFIYKDTHQQMDSINILLPFALQEKISKKEFNNPKLNYKISLESKEDKLQIFRSYEMDAILTSDDIVLDSLAAVSSRIEKFNHSEIIFKEL